MKLIKLSAIDSTNDYLKQLSNASSLEDGTTVVAFEQTRGKGQLGSSWHSEAGKSLTFSLFKRFEEMELAKQAMVNWAVSLAIYDCLVAMGFKNITIKWPNDIMAGSGKLAGILIENQIRHQRIRSSVIGIGMNVNNLAFSNVPNATSLRVHKGVDTDIDALLIELIRLIMLELNQITDMDPTVLQSKYESLLYRKDQVSVFETQEGNIWNGIIQGVTVDGKLKVAGESDEIRTFGLKEVRLKN